MPVHTHQRLLDSSVAPFRPLLLITLVVLSAAMLCGYYLELTLPIEAGVILLLTTSVWGLLYIRITKLSPLVRLMVLLYCFPFSALVGYLLVDDFAWGVTPMAVAVESQSGVMPDLVATGTIGLLGLLAGISIAPLLVVPVRPTRGFRTIPSQGTGTTLSKPTYLAGLALASFLSWVSAPSATIWQASYASEDTGSVAGEINFNSSVLISYLVIILWMLDAERHPQGSAMRRWKTRAVLITVAYIAVYLQMMRGDRDVAGLVAGLACQYLTADSWAGFGWRSVNWNKLFKTSLPVAGIVVLLIALGSARFLLSESGSNVSFSQMFEEGLTANTWTYVLLTNLGVANEHISGQFSYLYGRTYLDYLISTPPGILTASLGIERPLESTSGPNYWYAGLSMGGMHPVGVPFKNFGAIGLWIIMGLYGFLIARLEIVNTSGQFFHRLMYCSVATTSFFWFWYGDMNIIRCVMIASILGWWYRLACADKKLVPNPRMSINARA